MRILYVEDNPANVYLVKRVANAGRHEVINYVDGGRVLRDFDQINPDLVLMDIQLVGELSGIDVVKKLRSEGHQVPIIAVNSLCHDGRPGSLHSRWLQRLHGQTAANPGTLAGVYKI